MLRLLDAKTAVREHRKGYSGKGTGFSDGAE
jgi:hypothetical protein